MNKEDCFRACFLLSSTMRNPNERASPVAPHSENDHNGEGRGASLQGASSLYHRLYAPSSQIHNLHFTPAGQIYSDRLRNPHPSSLSLHPTNITNYPNFIEEGSGDSFDNIIGNQYLFSNPSLAASGHRVGGSAFGANVPSNSIPFLPRGSQSYLSHPHQSFDNTNISGASGDHNSSILKGKQVISILWPDPDVVDSSKLIQAVLLLCVRALSRGETASARSWMDNVLENMVSVSSGEPMQRLGAYLLVGLRVRLELGSLSRALTWKQPTSSELLIYKHMLYLMCPYLKFAYRSANKVIREAMINESRIHIIDFQIGQGFQWKALILALADRPGGAPYIRMTGFDDRQSEYARGGGLHIVRQHLCDFAKSLGVTFELHYFSEHSPRVVLNDLLRPGEAVAVCFPYYLQSIPDESARNELLRFVKSLSPKVVTLAEKECNTNTSSFNTRFLEVMNYYTAVFESIDVAKPRYMHRIFMERECLAAEIINMIAFDGDAGVTSHDHFHKWRSRFEMAGFTQCQLSPSVTMAVREMLMEYDNNYRYYEQTDGALYLGWKNRAMASFSTWR